MVLGLSGVQFGSVIIRVLPRSNPICLSRVFLQNEVLLLINHMKLQIYIYIKYKFQ